MIGVKVSIEKEFNLEEEDIKGVAVHTL